MIKSGPSDALGVQQLRAFCRVFERQSYAAAARDLGLSVPTVWEQVRAVERRYGTELLERRGRRIAPTPAGELLCASLRPLLAGLDSTFERVREGAGEGPRRITLVTGVRLMLEDLGGALRAFRRRHPDVTLRVLPGDDREAERRILADEADLGLLIEPPPGRAGAGIAVEPAYEVEYLAVLPPRDPLARRRALRLRDLAARPLVVGHPGTHGRQILEAALHREGVRERLRVAVETDNSAFILACVRAGLGVGFVAGRPDGLLTRGLQVRPLRRVLGAARIAFLSKRGRQPTRAVQALKDAVRGELSN